MTFGQSSTSDQQHPRSLGRAATSGRTAAAIISRSPARPAPIALPRPPTRARISAAPRARRSSASAGRTRSAAAPRPTPSSSAAVPRRRSTATFHARQRRHDPQRRHARRQRVDRVQHLYGNWQSVPGMVFAGSSTASTIAAPLSTTMGMVKFGPGTLVLSGNNSSLTGGIVVSSGVLECPEQQCPGARRGRQRVLVAAGAELDFKTTLPCPRSRSASAARASAAIAGGCTASTRNSAATSGGGRTRRATTKHGRSNNH